MSAQANEVAALDRELDRLRELDGRDAERAADCVALDALLRDRARAGRDDSRRPLEAE